MVTRIRVGARGATVADVLEYAIELIKTFGRNPGAPAGGGDMQPSSEEAGFTLHDAIGEACTRLSAATGAAKGTKDWTVTTPEGEIRQLRTEAVALVTDELPEGMNDYQFNDKAASDAEVIDVLDRALAKAKEGASA